MTAEVRSVSPFPGAVPLQPRRERGDAGLSRSSHPSLHPLQQLPRRFGTAEVTARGRSVLPAPDSRRGLFLPEPLSFPFSSLSLWHRLHHRVRSRQPASEELKISSFLDLFRKVYFKTLWEGWSEGGWGRRGEGKCCCSAFSPEAQLVSQALSEICAVCKRCSV